MDTNANGTGNVCAYWYTPTAYTRPEIMPFLCRGWQLQPVEVAAIDDELLDQLVQLVGCSARFIRLDVPSCSSRCSEWEWPPAFRMQCEVCGKFSTRDRGTYTFWNHDLRAHCIACCFCKAPSRATCAEVNRAGFSAWTWRDPKPLDIIIPRSGPRADEPANVAMNAAGEVRGMLWWLERDAEDGRLDPHLAEDYYADLTCLACRLRQRFFFGQMLRQEHICQADDCPADDEVRLEYRPPVAIEFYAVPCSRTACSTHSMHCQTKIWSEVE